MQNFSNQIKPFEEYLRGLNNSKHTIKQYVIDIKKFVLYLNKQEDDMKIAAENYYKDLQENGSSISSINRSSAAIKKFLTFLHDRQLVDVALVEIFKRVKEEKKELLPLTIEQRTSALSVWPHMLEMSKSTEHYWLALRNIAIVHVIAELAIKPSEVVRMKWSHLRIDEGELVIQGARSNRVLSVSPWLIELLLDYQEETKLFLPVANEVDAIWLAIGNKQGEAMSVKTIERIFQFISKNIGRKVTPTDLRYFTLLKNEDHTALYQQLGYARKSVLFERKQRFKN